MKQSGICPKCESTEIVADAKAIDFGESNFQRELSVGVYEKPDAIIFKQQRRSTLSAWVCLACGYTEFYADNPQALRLPKWTAD